MTSGNFSSGSMYGPLYHTRTWSGLDGKYEIVSGVRRLKINDYTTERSSQVGSPSLPDPVFGSQRFISCLADPDWEGIWSGLDELALQSKLSSRIRRHQFNLAVNVAEGKKTVAMVTQNLTALGKAFRAARRGDWKQSLASLRAPSNSRKLAFSSKEIASRWLELQYGWLPLLSSTYDAAKAFEAYTSGPRVNSLRVFRVKSGPYNGSQSPTLWSGNGSYRYLKSYRCEMMEQMSAVRELGLMDPASVAWELIPYSFVVDWFVPIGTYLENLAVIPFLTQRYVTTTSRLQRCEGRGFIIPPSHFYDEAWCKSQVFRYERTVSTGLTTARPGFKSLPDAMSSKRIWNAIALARQRFKVAV